MKWTKHKENINEKEGFVKINKTDKFLVILKTSEDINKLEMKGG
jgi:hypothetical protein